MFSISTMASSTNTPTTSDRASRVTMLMVNPNRYIQAKVGMIASGSAVAATMVARVLRRKNTTTSTASAAPSNIISIEPWYASRTVCTVVNTSSVCISGLLSFSLASATSTPSATETSLAPSERITSNPTTGLPSCSAALRRSAMVSLTSATCSRRTRRPSFRLISICDNSSAVFTVASVRTDCSSPPRSALPPGASCWISRSRCDMSAAVRLRASSFTGSSSTRTCRVTPPTRFTAPTPFTPSSNLAMLLSTYQDNSSSVMPGEVMV